MENNIKSINAMNTTQMYTQIVTVTPEIARQWLEMNMSNNRPVMKSTVHSYARMMRNGNWNLTHQGIAFDERGELIDGQHRLYAVIEANIPVMMNVTYNVHREPGETFTIDMGRKRTYANIVAMSGISDSVFKNTGTFVSAFIRFKIPGNRKADPAEILDYTERHYDDLKKVDELCINGTHSHGNGEGRNRIPAIVGAALMAAIYRGENMNALRMFCDVYRSNDVVECVKAGYNPKFVMNLRDYVRNNRPRQEVIERCESAIHAFCHKAQRFTIKDNYYPFNQALDA